MQLCGGWTDYQGMGISIGSVTYLHPVTNEIVSFVDSNPKLFYGKLIELKKVHGYQVGGFNTRRFDDKLLIANGFPLSSDFDILELVKRAAGAKHIQKGISYSLDNILKANGMAKNGDGAFAPLLFQEKKYEELASYVENDSLCEYKVLQLLIEGQLIDPNTGRKLKWSL